MKIHKNDTVLVTTGRNKGKQGKVYRVFLEEHRVLIEGVNIVKRHTKPTGTLRQAGIVEKEAPIDVSNVKLVCPHCGKPTRISFSFLEDGAKVRVCHNCKETI